MAPHKSDLSLDDIAIRKEVYCLWAYSGFSSYVLYLLLPCSPFHTLCFYFKLFTIELRFASLTLFAYIAKQFCRWQVHLHVRLSPFPLSLVLCVEYLSCTVSDLRIKKTPFLALSKASDVHFLPQLLFSRAFTLIRPFDDEPSLPCSRWSFWPYVL